MCYMFLNQYYALFLILPETQDLDNDCSLLFVELYQLHQIRLLFI